MRERWFIKVQLGCVYM